MPQVDLRDAPFLDSLEQQLEVIALSGIDDVEDGVGLKLADPVTDCREVSRGVGVRPVSFANDERSLKAGDEDADGPVAFDRHPVLKEFIDDTGQHRVEPTLAEGQVELDVEPVVDAL